MTGDEIDAALAEDRRKREAEVREGLQAREVLSSEGFTKRMDAVRSALMLSWEKSKPEEIQKREDAWRSIRLLDRLLDVLRSDVETGKLAAQQLDLTSDRARVKRTRDTREP